LIALGDIRHVLLSSVQLVKLQFRYKLVEQQAVAVAGILAELFNARLIVKNNGESLKIQNIIPITTLPGELKDYLVELYENLLLDKRLSAVLEQEHCLGNLLLVSSIYKYLHDNVDLENGNSAEKIHRAIDLGLNELGQYIGCAEDGVMPCSSTPAQLRALYTNGVEVIGESKMSRSRRGYPVELVNVDFAREPVVYEKVLQSIDKADLIIFAPGSLYSSIIPILKIPQIVDAVRNNQQALKLMVANLWVQAGETDLSIPDPSRKFFVSDMIKAYEKNIPGGITGIFNRLLCLRLNDVPASIVQKYAVEGKMPIYLDREEVQSLGYLPIECGVYSKKALMQQGVIQHDADMLAQAVKAVYWSVVQLNLSSTTEVKINNQQISVNNTKSYCQLPSLRYKGICNKVEQLKVKCDNRDLIEQEIKDLLWTNRDIPLGHLDFVRGVECIPAKLWERSQKWDNVFSFYDPADSYIKIREDMLEEKGQFRVGFLIALGEAILGDYALRKKMENIILDGSKVGRIYHLFLRNSDNVNCFFTADELDTWLRLTRMNPFENSDNHYLRILNKDEGFTPPGLFLGLLYAWYIDNRLATHIEYKMSVMKIMETSLVPEQKKMSARRMKMIDFMRTIVFNPARNN